MTTPTDLSALFAGDSTGDVTLTDADYSADGYDDTDNDDTDDNGYDDTDDTDEITDAHADHDAVYGS